MEAADNSGVKQTTGNPPIKYYVNSFITTAIMLGFGFLPAPEPITPMGMKIVGIFIGALYGWSTVGAIWPSILTMVLLGLTGYITVKDAFMQGFGNDTVLFIFFLFLFCSIIDQMDVTKYFANKLITAKFVQGRPWILAAAIFLAGYICAALTSTVPTMIICWSIVQTMATEMGYKRGDTYPTILIIGVTLCAQLGYTAMPFKLGYVMLSGLLTQMTGLFLDPLKYFLVSLVVGVTVPGIYLLVCKFILRPDISKCQGYEAPFAQKGTLNHKQQLVLCIMTAMVIFMLIPSVFSGDFWLVKLLNDIGLTAIVALTVSVLFFLHWNKQPLVEAHAILSKAIIWDVIFLLASALVLSKALTAEGTGIQPFLHELFGPVLAGHSAVFFTFIALGIAIIATNFSNNMVVMLILMPIMATFSTEVGINMLSFSIALVYTTGMALLTPAASPFAAILHGHDWLKKTVMIQHVLLLILISWLVAACVTVPLGNLIFQ